MIEHLKRRFKQEKGFTLVELLAVIAILGIILAIAIPSVGKVIESSKEDADEANIDLIENAARLAYLNEENTKYEVSDLNNDGYLEEIPKIPGSEDEYDGSVTVTKEDGAVSYNYDGNRFGDD